MTAITFSGGAEGFSIRKDREGARTHHAKGVRP